MILWMQRGLIDESVHVGSGSGVFMFGSPLPDFGGPEKLKGGKNKQIDGRTRDLVKRKA